MKLDVYNLSNEKVDEIEVADEVFGAEVKQHLFWEVVRMQLANRRRGTHKTKNRSEVRGGGRKPYRQKGTGRARQGSIRAPHWVGGGHAHARRPRDYSYQLNKKKKRAALRSALSMLASEGRLKVLDSFQLEAIKTREALRALSALEVARAVVIDAEAISTEGQLRSQNNETLRRSVRNLQAFKYLRPEGVNVYDLLHYGAAVVTRDAIAALEARLK